MCAQSGQQEPACQPVCTCSHHAGQQQLHRARIAAGSRLGCAAAAALLDHHTCGLLKEARGMPSRYELSWMEQSW